MPFLRTSLATDFPIDTPKTSWAIEKLLSFVPKANPDYEPKLHLVREWLIEFDADGLPNREIGLDATGVPIIAGPDHRNYGFWLDTNMTFDDFQGSDLARDEFESNWNLIVENIN